MLKIVLLVALVAAVSAAAKDPSESDASTVDKSSLKLLKRLLNALYKTESKRAFQYITYTASDNKLKVYFQVCVQGDQSTTPCRSGVTGHSLRVALDSTDAQVYYKYESSYLTSSGSALTKTYDLSSVLTTGKKYKVSACETKNNGAYKLHCTDGEFTEGTDNIRAEPGDVYNP